VRTFKFFLIIIAFFISEYSKYYREVLTKNFTKMPGRFMAKTHSAKKEGLEQGLLEGERKVHAEQLG